MSAADKLKSAEQAARQKSSPRRIDDPAVPCPLDQQQQQQQQRYAIEVSVAGEDGAPLADMALELRMSPDAVLRDKTGAGGTVRFDGLPAQGYELSLYELDQDAWELAGLSALPPARAASAGEAGWRVPAPPPGRPAAHTCVQGDSVSSISQLYGYFPDTLWLAAENAELRALRDNRDILHPGDRVSLPPPRTAHVGVQAGQACRLTRKGVPTMLRIRFVDCEMRARAGIAYVCDIENARAQVFAQTSGVTDGAGVAAIAVPLDATRARLVLSVDGGEEIHLFRLGHMDPVDTDSGVRSRLVNLRYLQVDPARDSAGDSAADLRSALLRFQHEHALEETGVADDATRAALKQAHRS